MRGGLVPGMRRCCGSRHGKRGTCLELDSLLISGSIFAVLALGKPPNRDHRRKHQDQDRIQAKPAGAIRDMDASHQCGACAQSCRPRLGRANRRRGKGGWIIRQVGENIESAGVLASVRLRGLSHTWELGRRHGPQRQWTNLHGMCVM